MPFRFSEQAALVNLGRGGLQELLNRYPGLISDLPFIRCIDVLGQLGAKFVVVETNYFDPDYRSEYFASHARSFLRAGPVADRLHFFSARIGQSDIADLPKDVPYLGYVVLRPQGGYRVCRAMIPPPPNVKAAVTTLVTEEVHFFGQPLMVQGVPFASQDGRLTRCAHVCAWMAHYNAYLRGEADRVVRAEFNQRTNLSLHPERDRPSLGLSVRQVADLFRKVDLPAFFYPVSEIPSMRLDSNATVATSASLASHVVPIACRYLNSGLPMILSGAGHTVLLCGYAKESSKSSKYHFVAHCDERGPYLVAQQPTRAKISQASKVDDQRLLDGRGWEHFFIPAHPRIELPPEPAELHGVESIRTLSKRVLSAARVAAGGSRPAKAAITASGEIVGLVDIERLYRSGELSFRTYASSSVEFKRRLKDRGLSAEATEAYRLSWMPKYVWVVEAHLKKARHDGRPAVLGEALIDPTSSDKAPNVLVAHVPGVLEVSGGARRVIEPFVPLYRSGMVHR
jgi:hypothetical protein